MRTLLLGTIVTHGAGCFLDSQGNRPEGGSASVGGGGQGAGGAAEGGGAVCQTADECGTAAECRVLSCNDGACDDDPAPTRTPCGDMVTEACDGRGNCRTIDGETCAADRDCASGVCADDVCCASACEGVCNSCALVPAGTCTVYAPDVDPDDECGPGVCDGASSCANGDTAASGSFGDKAAAFAVATYANGDAVIAGDFEGPVGFGGPALPGSGGNRDVFVARLGADGSHVWSRGFGGDDNQVAFSAAVGPAGEAIVGGPFAGTIDFGGLVGPRTSVGGNDAFVLKLAADGSTTWASVFGDGGEQLVIGVGVDDAGAVYIAGFFTGTIDFGGADLTSAGAEDAFIAKFLSDGTHVWSKKFGDAASQLTAGFAVNGAGECAITGTFDGVIDFGGDALISAGGRDTYLAKLDAAGAHLFSGGFGDDQAQLSHGVGIDENGSVAVAGGYVGTMDFGLGALPLSEAQDIFIGVFGPTGDPLWSAGFGDAGEQIGWGVAFDGSGNVTLVGDTDGSADFGGPVLTSAGNTDLFAAKFSADGTELWSFIFGNNAAQHAEAVAIGQDNDVWMVGNFDGNLAFGGPALINGGQPDGYFVRLSP